MYLTYALLWYLKRFGTVEKQSWKHENKDMTRFYTIFWLVEKKLKAMKLNGTLWRFLRLIIDDY